MKIFNDFIHLRFIFCQAKNNTQDTGIPSMSYYEKNE